MNRLRIKNERSVHSLRILPAWLTILLFLIAAFATSCRYKEPRFSTSDSIPQLTVDSISYLYQYHYTWGTNLIIQADTLLLAQLPITDTYDTLYRGDTIVVAEFMINPTDSLDSVWVKVAHNQDIQGWIREREVNRDLAPVHFISQLILLFSKVHESVFFVLIAVFVLIYSFKLWKRERLRLVFYHDIDSAYPILLCFLTACSATLYETIQMFYPETWEHFYFNPTLNPLNVPFVLSLFLLGLWGIVVVWLAAIEETLKMLRFSAALFYLIGLVAACVACYLFFVFAAHLLIGYPLLLYFFYKIIRKAVGTHTYHYRCGRCGTLLREKGKCPSCGAINE